MTVKCPKCQHDNPADTVYCGRCATPLPEQEEPQAVHTKTLETTSERLTTGMTFAGRYQIIEELGKGGMGKVFRVLDKELNEEVALKMIKPEIAVDKQTIERFKNELKLARKISQRNVGRMYELMEEQGAHFITMEYVSGQDLRALIRQTGRLTVGKAVSIAKEICDGLEEAHRLGVVHRDLKPSNIIIDKSGNARIMDFGIARSIEGKKITGAGVMIGTPEYMSPEQVEGKETDQRSDVYSLGVVLYEMVTGKVPFEGDTPFTVGVKHKSEIPKDPKELNAQVSDDLSRVILKCLEKDKAHRYQKAGDISSELIKIEEGIPTTERVIPEKKPLTSKEITVKFSLKKLLIPAVVVLGVVIIAIVLFRGGGARLDQNRVVVDIFENKTGDKSLDSIGAMAADWITQGLAQTGVVEIVPNLPEYITAQTSQGKERTRFLSEETGAGVVVSGSYYLRDENLRFHAQVVDARKGKLLGAIDPVEGPITDPLKPIESLRQRVMGSVASLFDSTFGDMVISITTQPPTYEAYQEYLTGSKFFNQNDFRKAIEHLLHAFDLDPNFVLSQLMASVAFMNLGDYEKAETLIREVEKSQDKLSPNDRGMLEWSQAIFRGDIAAQHRICRRMAESYPGTVWVYQWGSEANANNHPQETVDAYAKLDPEKGMMKGWYFYWYHLTQAHHMLGNHKQELKEAQRGRKQYPDLLATLWYEVRALAALGKIEEINKRLDESLTLPPQRGWNPGRVMSLAGQYLRAHGYKQASMQVLDKAFAWFEGRPQEEALTRTHRSRLAGVLYTVERWEDAKTLYQALHEEFPASVTYLGYLGTVVARLGEREESLRISSQLESLKTPYLFGNHTYWRACIIALLGEKEQAMTLLRDSLAQGVSYTRLFPDMDLDPLRDYPPFQELIKPKQ